MRTITRLAGWTFGWVLANQVALVVMLALADGAKVPGGVSAYTYAYTFFQLPYGVVAVSVMSAVTPSLAARWALRDMVAFRHRMAFGLRGILAIIIPSAVGMVILAHPLIDLVLAHGAETTASADTTAATLAMFSLGLPGFCTFLYMIRVFQAMQDTRTAFRLYLVENGVNIVAGVLLVGPLGVRGLALSVSIAYTLAAILALSVVRQRVGGLGGDDLTTPVKRVAGCHRGDGRGHGARPQRVRCAIGSRPVGPGGAGGGGRCRRLRGHGRSVGGAPGPAHRRRPSPPGRVPAGDRGGARGAREHRRRQHLRRAVPWQTR